MISSPKSTYIFRFIFYFSITLVILGIGQAIFGTFRLYNPSEQEYETLSPEKVVSDTAENIPPPETTLFVPFVTVWEENVTDSQYFVAENVISPEISKPKIIKNSWNVAKKDPEKTTLSIALSPVTVSVIPKKAAAPKHYLKATETVVTGRYFDEALWKFPIIIDTDRIEPRWQMYNESITLGSSMSSLSEIAKVLVHEIGHMIDIYTFKKTLKNSDLSDEFYRISWKDATTIKAGVPQKAFISGYAATNQYEDFAESFTMYIFHNKEFFKRTQDNELLKLKYTFLKNRVFWTIFTGTSYEQNTIPQKIWDVTKIAIRWNNIDPIFAWLTVNIPYRS